MTRSPSPTLLRRLSLVSLLALALAGRATAQDSKKTIGRTDDACARHAERIDGVIVKVEPIGGQAAAKSDAPRRVRVTVNTAAVWRDFSRDTATTKAESTSEAAKKGEQSIATKGQPRDKDTLVVLEITPDTKLQRRYRAEMDERSLGAASPDEARKLAAADTTGDRDRTKAAATQPDGTSGKALKADELKTGLFIVAAYRHADDADRADWVVVLDPVRDGDKP